MSLSNQSIINQNYIENEDLVSTVDFRVQSTVSWGRSFVVWTWPQSPFSIHKTRDLSLNLSRHFLATFCSLESLELSWQKKRITWRWMQVKCTRLTSTSCPPKRSKNGLETLRKLCFLRRDFVVLLSSSFVVLFYDNRALRTTMLPREREERPSVGISLRGFRRRLFRCRCQGKTAQNWTGMFLKLVYCVKWSVNI